MDASVRNTTALVGKIERLRDDMIRRFANLIQLATVERNDRNTTALAQYQIQVDTAGLIRTFEEAQSLVRQLQEIWLFGQLNTIADNTTNQETNEDVKAIASMLEQMSAMQPSSAFDGAVDGQLHNNDGPSKPA